MQTSQLSQVVVAALEEMKARDISPIDVREQTDVTDTLIICTSTSSRHSRSIADYLRVAVKAEGVQALSVSGEEKGEWILVDLADVVVHIMLAEAREFYHLEKLWQATQQARDSEN